MSTSISVKRSPAPASARLMASACSSATSSRPNSWIARGQAVLRPHRRRSRPHRSLPRRRHAGSSYLFTSSSCSMRRAIGASFLVRRPKGLSEAHQQLCSQTNERSSMPTWSISPCTDDKAILLLTTQTVTFARRDKSARRAFAVCSLADWQRAEYRSRTPTERARTMNAKQAIVHIDRQSRASPGKSLSLFL